MLSLVVTHRLGSRKVSKQIDWICIENWGFTPGWMSQGDLSEQGDLSGGWDLSGRKRKIVGGRGSQLSEGLGAALHMA